MYVFIDLQDKWYFITLLFHKLFIQIHLKKQIIVWSVKNLLTERSNSQKIAVFVNTAYKFKNMGHVLDLQIYAGLFLMSIDVDHFPTGDSTTVQMINYH